LKEFTTVTTNFVGHFDAKNDELLFEEFLNDYKLTGYKMPFKIYFGLAYQPVPANLRDVSDEHWEHFHREM
jgi:hypothetical protein